MVRLGLSGVTVMLTLSRFKNYLQEIGEISLRSISFRTFRNLKRMSAPMASGCFSKART
ncbi:hypothetical protein [Paenibacillus odorifer]|uniref:hypothetical protein n=1 Tax=Paenibacillus odorifer TaxID=189426 RepID=UPI000AE65603|nr:hypothetical protein [Paenibacillus odorifer]